MKIRLTHNAINGLKPKEKGYWVTDAGCPNLLLYVGTSGKKVWYVHYRDKSNKWKHGKLGEASVMNTAVARDAAINFKADINQGNFPNAKKPNALTLGELVEEYYRGEGATKKTGLETLAMLRAQFEPLFNHVVTEMTAADFDEWRSSRMLEGKKSSSLNRYRAALMSVLNWGVEKKLIETNPLSRWKPLDESNIDPRVRYLSDEERTRLFDALEERERRLLGRPADRKNNTYADHLKPIVLLALNTALRRGSILSLTWGDIDFEERIITVKALNSKNSKTQRVPMNKTAEATLREWKKQSSDVSNAAYVFPSPKTGGVMNECRSAWDNLLKAAQIENFHWHDMRHDAATRMRRKGAPLDVVQQNLGHASVKTTQRYAHIGEDEKRNAMNLLDDEEQEIRSSPLAELQTTQVMNDSKAVTAAFESSTNDSP